MKRTAFFCLILGSLSHQRASIFAEANELQQHSRHLDEDQSDEESGDDSDFGVTFNEETKSVEVDLLKIFGQIQDWVEKSEQLEGVKEIFSNFRDTINAELSKWVSEHWEGQWTIDSGDRWDSRN